MPWAIISKYIINASCTQNIYYKDQANFTSVAFARFICLHVDGAFTKPRRLHLAKGCEHSAFQSRRGCRKHVKTKHGWYYYFDEKPNVCLSPFASTETQPKGCKTVPGCSTDNDFACSFSKWLQSSCGGGKSLKQSDISVSRALKFIKFCCDENGDGEEDVLNSPNLIDYALGSPQLLTKFVDSLKEK